MIFPPDQLFLQSATIIYFSGWLWLLCSLGLVSIRPGAWPWFSSVIGLVLLVTALGWVYLIIFILIEAGANPFRLPLSLELILIAVIGVTYVPLAPWRQDRPTNVMMNIPPFVRTARLELIGLLVILPIVSLISLAPFGAAITGWFPSLLGSNPALFGLIGVLLILTIGLTKPAIRNYLILIGFMLIILGTTYLVMVAALVATI